MKASEILLSLERERLEVCSLDGGIITVQYQNCDVKDGYFLEALYGRGRTFEDACEDYLKQIRGRTLVFNAYSKNRRETKVLG